MNFFNLFGILATLILVSNGGPATRNTINIQKDNPRWKWGSILIGARQMDIDYGKWRFWFGKWKFE